MSINKISLQETKTPVTDFKQSSLVSFKGNNSLERTETSDKVIKESRKDSNWGKYTLGTVLLLGALVGSDFIFAKGKHVKKILGIKPAEETKKAVDAVTDKSTELKDIISETLEDFTKSGKNFNNGKALTADNKPFTGKISMRNENSGTNIFEYKDGNFVSVSSFDKDGKAIQSNIRPIPPSAINENRIGKNPIEINESMMSKWFSSTKDIDSFVDNHYEYHFAPSVGHPQYKLCLLLHDFLEIHPELKGEELSKQLEKMAKEWPERYKENSYFENYFRNFDKSTIASKKNLVYEGIGYVEGDGVLGATIHSPNIVGKNVKNLEHSYNISDKGGLELKQRFKPTLPQDNKPPIPPTSPHDEPPVLVACLAMKPDGTTHVFHEVAYKLPNGECVMLPRYELSTLFMDNLKELFCKKKGGGNFDFYLELAKHNHPFASSEEINLRASLYERYVRFINTHIS